jgi:hypothetical protein
VGGSFPARGFPPGLAANSADPSESYSFGS